MIDAKRSWSGLVKKGQVLTITDSAKEYMNKVADGKYVTLGVRSGGCAGLEYEWGLSDSVEHETIKWTPIDDILLIDPMAEMFMFGSVVDYVNELGGAYLKVVNPMAQSQCGCGTSFSA